MFALKDKVSTDLPAHGTRAVKNNTGIPNHLKSGIERLSGYSMDDVKIHYNSTKPAQLQALAYTQKNSVYLGAGQEKHLGHELWHVVQQKQGRVMPTKQIDGFQVNDNAALEREADLYGWQAARLKTESPLKPLSDPPMPAGNTLQLFTEGGVVYNTVGEYYRSLNGETDTARRRKIILDQFIAAFSETFIFGIDISHCESPRQLTDKIEAKLYENPVDLLVNVFELHKKNIKPYMDDLSHHNTQSEVFQEHHPLIHKYIHDWDFLNLMHYHERLDRIEAPGSGEAPSDPDSQIDPTDISEPFVKEKSCVITALFHAEPTRITNEFHASSVEEFHTVLVSAFSRSKYTGNPTATPHQINNVWKNYSDDSVYPGLYAYFGYKPHKDLDCVGMNLRTAVKRRVLPSRQGMICLKQDGSSGAGHMLYFNNTKNPPEFFDNDNGPHALAGAANKKIMCVYYKG